MTSPVFKHGVKGYMLAIMPRRSDVMPLGLSALLLGSLFFLFHYNAVTDIGYVVSHATESLFGWISNRWRLDRMESVFAHGHLIPGISLGLVWLDRHKLLALPARPHPGGFILLAMNLLLHWLGLITQQPRLSLLSLIGMTWAIPFALFGWPIARRLLFPCAFLIFIMPLKHLDFLINPLRVLAAQIAAGTLSGLAIDATRVGLTIEINHGTAFAISMDDHPNDFFSAVSVIALSLLCACLIKARLPYRMLLVALSPAIFVLANVMRILTCVFSGKLFGVPASDACTTHVSIPLFMVLAHGGTVVASLYFNRHFRTDSTASNALAGTPPFKPVRSVALLILLVLAGILWNGRGVDVAFLDDAGVNTDIPLELGLWRGERVLYCHEPACQEAVVSNDLEPGAACPSCKSPLGEMSATERLLLPGDTIVRKYSFTDVRLRSALLAVVLSGEHRSSIHRPEVCLVGPNSLIDRSFVHQVKLRDGRVLRVKVLELIHQNARASGPDEVLTTYFAYWFHGMGKETPSHIVRMLWMAKDRILNRHSHRWSYISVSGLRKQEDQRHINDIDDLVQAAYPHLIKEHQPGQAERNSEQRRRH